MPTPTQTCVKCGRLFNASFNQCPFCKAPAAVPEKLKAEPVKCPNCGRLINPSFSECPFCKAKVTPAAPATSIDYTAIAEATVEHNKAFLVLDFSPASVLALDVFFDEMWGTQGYAPNDDNWQASQGQVAVVMNFGSYFGEVMRRRYNGRWVEDPNFPRNPLWSTVDLPGGDRLYAVAKVFKRLKNGSEDALESMFLHLRQTRNDAPSAEELESWLAQARHFERVKRPDHALKFYERALALPLSDEARSQVEAARAKAQAEDAAKAALTPPVTGETLFPVTPSTKPAPDFSAGVDEISAALTVAGVVLNDSPASLAAIDVWMDYLVGREPLPEEGKKKYKAHEWGIGCYLGQLLCARYGAQWRPDAEHPDCSHVAWPSGFVTCPFVYPSKRMERGTEYGIYKQFQACLSILRERGDAPPPYDESDEWMKQAESFASGWAATTWP